MISCASDLVLSSGSGPLGEAFYLTLQGVPFTVQEFVVGLLLFGYSSCPLVMNPRPPRR